MPTLSSINNRTKVCDKLDQVVEKNQHFAPKDPQNLLDKKMRDQLIQINKKTIRYILGKLFNSAFYRRIKKIEKDKF
jgi:hypothetical protein